MDRIGPSTRYGNGGRNSVKTVARRGVDVDADIAEINAGRALMNGDGDIVTSSGRLYGRHSESGNVFLRSGSPGTVDLTQAEFSILTAMVREGGLQGNALRQLEGLMRANNGGVSADSAAKLMEIFGS